MHPRALGQCPQEAVTARALARGPRPATQPGRLSSPALCLFVFIFSSQLLFDLSKQIVLAFTSFSSFPPNFLINPLFLEGSRGGEIVKSYALGFKKTFVTRNAYDRDF